jgi:uncharacterized protein YecT (DUF1311 family)
MRLLPIAAACAVIVMAGVAHAEPIRVVKPIDACALKTGDEQIACLTARLDTANQSLDATVATIRSHFPAGASYVGLFDVSDDAWVKEVAQTCHAAAMAHGDDGNGPFYLRCRIDMTTAREQLLKRLYAGS